MTTWNPPVPEGDTVAEHYCGRCRRTWTWCYCPAEACEALTNCSLVRGHKGICIDDEEAF